MYSDSERQLVAEPLSANARNVERRHRSHLLSIVEVDVRRCRRRLPPEFVDAYLDAYLEEAHAADAAAVPCTGEGVLAGAGVAGELAGGGEEGVRGWGCC